MVLIKVKQLMDINYLVLPSAQLIMTSYFIFWTSIHSFSLVIIKLIGVVDSNIMYY